MIRRSNKKPLYNNVYSQYKPPETNSLLRYSQKRAWSGLSVYKFVFTTNIAFGAALLLCLSLLLQPLTFAYADTTDSSTGESSEAAATPIPTQSQDPPVTSPSDLSDPISPSVLDDGDDEADQLPQQSDVTQTDTTAVESEEILATNASDSGVEIVSSEPIDTEVEPQIATDQSATTSVPQATSTAVTNDQSDTDTQADVPDSASADADSSASDESDSSQGPLSDIVASSIASTTSELITTGSISTVQTDNVFAFNKNECTEVADGSFYCQKISYDNLAPNDLFAAPDASGDMEIYVIQNGVQLKITDNTVDDAAPYYDARSETLVWHRLINDRYQIISHDVETGEETQITQTSVNNMEPSRNGDYTVWQRWVDNNWEIILLEDGQETQITTSVEHDIAPHIRGDLIIWNVRASDGTQSLMTYDIGSEMFNEIRDTDGVSVSNPRMLVMYEAQYQNGDTVMKGFDLITGEIVPIQRIPYELPTDIPSPEATGEVKALPNNPQSEEELASDSDLDTDEPEDPVVPYDPDDLNLASTTTTVVDPVLTLDFDLDLRPDETQQGATTTDTTLIDQAAIPDVVVPVFVDTQTSVQASSTQDQ